MKQTTVVDDPSSALSALSPPPQTASTSLLGRSAADLQGVVGLRLLYLRRYITSQFAIMDQYDALDSTGRHDETGL
jgi:hypothetical protein